MDNNIIEIKPVDDKIYLFRFKLPNDEYDLDMAQISENFTILRDFFKKYNKDLLGLPFGEDLQLCELEELIMLKEQIECLINKIQKSSKG